MHEKIVETRNYIDHFKYYSNHERSLLDLYSEIYEKFFDYSMNYRKSISFILPNILERYFVILRTAIIKNEGVVNTGGTKPQIVTRISVTGTSSEKLTYKIKKKEKMQEIRIPARYERYLKNVSNILAYYNKNKK